MSGGLEGSPSSGRAAGYLECDPDSNFPETFW